MEDALVMSLCCCCVRQLESPEATMKSFGVGMEYCKGGLECVDWQSLEGKRKKEKFKEGRKRKVERKT